MTHDLKIAKVFFPDIITGKKNFEVRVDDRGFKVGDILRLMEVETDSTGLIRKTGNQIFRKVKYILRDERFCKKNFIIMALGEI